MSTDTLNNWPSQGLPQHWSYGVTIDGRVFFMDDLNQTSTWIHPSFHQPVQSGFFNDFGLPRGWQYDVDNQLNILYINHNDRQNSYTRPSDQIFTSHPASLRHLMENPDETENEVLSKKWGSTKYNKKPMTERNYSYPIDMQGWIKRLEGSVIKQWYKRWFVLSNYCLYCYKDSSEYVLLKPYILPGLEVNTCLPKPGIPKKASFMIKHKNLKPIFLACDDTTQMVKWVEALQSAANTKDKNIKSFIIDIENYTAYVPEEKFKRSASLGREKKPRENKLNSLNYRENDQNLNDFGLNQNSRSRSFEHIPNKFKISSQEHEFKSYQDQSYNKTNSSIKNSNLSKLRSSGTFSISSRIGDKRNQKSARNSGNLEPGKDEMKNHPYGDQRSRTPIYRPSQNQDFTVDRRSSKRSFKLNQTANSINQNQPNDIIYGRSVSRRDFEGNDSKNVDLLLQQRMIREQNLQQNQHKELIHPSSSRRPSTNYLYRSSRSNDAVDGDKTNDKYKNPSLYYNRSQSNSNRNSNISLSKNISKNSSQFYNNPENQESTYRTQNDRLSNYNKSNRSSALSFQSNNIANNRHSKFSNALSQQNFPHQKNYQDLFTKNTFSNAPHNNVLQNGSLLPPNNFNQNRQNFTSGNYNNSYNQQIANNQHNAYQNTCSLAVKPAKPPHTNNFYKQLENSSRSNTMSNNSNYENNNPTYKSNENTIDRSYPTNDQNMHYLSNISNTQKYQNEKIKKPFSASLTRSLSSYSNKSNRKNYDNRALKRNSIKSNILPISNTNNITTNTLPNTLVGSEKINDKENFKMPQLPRNFSIIREDSETRAFDLQPTKNLDDLKKKLASHTRLRLSISVQDLMGRSYEKLVLFLIQLKRSQAELESTCQEIRQQPITSHSNLVIENQLKSVEKQMEVTQPLINLLDNMLMMSSLYNGDAMLYASQYKQNQMARNELKPAKPMLEFNRSRQEMEIAKYSNNGLLRNSSKRNIEAIRRMEEQVKLLQELNNNMQHLDSDIDSCQQNRIIIENALQEMQHKLSLNPANKNELLASKEMFENDLNLIYKDLYNKHELMTNIQKEIKTIEDNIENVKLKINDSNETLSVKNEKKIEAEDSLKSISDFLKESLEQKNAIHNNLTSLKSSKSNAALELTGSYLETDLDTGVTKNLSSQNEMPSSVQNNWKSDSSGSNSRTRSRSDIVDNNNNFKNFNYNDTTKIPHNDISNYEDRSTNTRDSNTLYRSFDGRNVGNKNLLATEKQSKQRSLETPQSRQNPKFGNEVVVQNLKENDFDFNAHNIESTLFGPPPLVDIPQRYVAERDSDVSDVDDAFKEEKIEQVRKLVAVHSLQEFSLNELGKMTENQELSERYQKELEERENLLEKKRKLAELVTEKSKHLAAERQLK